MKNRIEEIDATVNKQTIEEICAMVFKAIRDGVGSGGNISAFGGAEPKSIILTVLTECMHSVCNMESIDRFSICNSNGMICFLSNEHQDEINRIIESARNQAGKNKEPVH